MILSKFKKYGKLIAEADIEMTMFPGTDRPQSICYALSGKALELVFANSNISAVIIPKSLQEAALKKADLGILVSDDPQASYYQIHNDLTAQFKGLVEVTRIADSAQIASSAIIKDRVQIGENVIIEDGAMVFEDSIIGDNTYIGPGAIIGTGGLQHFRSKNKFFNVRQVGGVKIGNNCSILARALVQKPYQAFYTVLGDRVKLSVKSSVGHGATIGDQTLIAGGCTLGGNVRLGERVWVGPGATIKDGISIGNEAKVFIGSTVVQSIASKGEVSGAFAVDHKLNLRNFAKLRRDGQTNKT